MIVVSRSFLVSTLVLLTQLLLPANHSLASLALDSKSLSSDSPADGPVVNENNNQWPPRHFHSAQAAAKAAADLYNPCSIQEDREYIGVILEEDGLFRYTVASGTQGADRISIRVPLSDWENTVAFWHTHGSERQRYRYSSDTDTKLVKRFGKPFYLADFTGILKVFRPGDKKINPYRAKILGLPGTQGYAFGSVVRDKSDQSVMVNTRSCLKNS